MAGKAERTVYFEDVPPPSCSESHGQKNSPLSNGLSEVDAQLYAVDADWSGLKLTRRRA
jgi:hypothetical protein